MGEVSSIQQSVLAVFLVLLIPIPLAAQGPASSASRRYNNGLVILKSGERFQAKRLIFERNTLTFNVTGSHETKRYPLADVDYVSRTKRNTLGGAAIGGVLGLTGVLTGIAQAEANPYLELKENAFAIGAGIVGGGVLIGALVGSAFRSNKAVFRNGRLVVKVDPPSPIFHGDSSGMGVGLLCLRVAY